MTPIFLIGYMGSGKTTLGREAARRAGLTFLDLDHAIESRYHASVTRLFELYGESGFRRLESTTLREVASGEDVIVACGGGTPCFHDNMELMRSRGLTVYLEASIPTLARRLAAAKAKRPLIAALADDELPPFINKALQQRLPSYSRAQVTFSSDLLEDKGQIDATVTRFIDEVVAAHRLNDSPNDRKP